MEQSKLTEWEIVDHFGVLTINNPPQNFLTEPEIAGLSDLQRWTAGDSLKGMIVQGKGRHFSAGADRNNIMTAPDEEGIRANLAKGKEVLDYLWDLPIPTIAAIRGVCMGGGLEVALACHIRVCSEKSLFSFPETGLGIMPGLHGTVKLPGIVGTANAIDILLTGKTIDAQEALRLKLVDYVVPSKEVFDFSLNSLRRLTDDKPISVIHAVMRSFVNARKLSEDEAVEKLSEMYGQLALDFSQGPKADG
ncbi:MAG: enoyl-CoA hydratase/isomerase family protein [Candidatus Fermentibacteria bacterium]